MLLWREGSRDDHSGRRSCVGSLQQADAKGPAGWPSRIAGVEFTKDKRRVIAAILCKGQYYHYNANHTGEGPENGKGL